MELCLVLLLTVVVCNASGNKNVDSIDILQSTEDTVVGNNASGKENVGSIDILHSIEDIDRPPGNCICNESSKNVGRRRRNVDVLKKYKLDFLKFLNHDILFGSIAEAIAVSYMVAHLANESLTETHQTTKTLTELSRWATDQTQALEFLENSMTKLERMISNLTTEAQKPECVLNRNLQRVVDTQQRVYIFGTISMSMSIAIVLIEVVGIFRLGDYKVVSCFKKADPNQHFG